MIEQQRPSVRRRRLSEELRRLRHAAGMTLDDAARALEWSVGKVSNIETGVRKRPSVVEVKALLDTYRVNDQWQRESLLSITRQAGKKGWWTKYDDVFPDEFPALEAEAASISTYQLIMIPGLLQTPKYVELFTRSANLLRDPVDVERVVAARRKRQEILSHPDGPELRAVIDACAIERLKPSPRVLQEQVRHLIDVAEADNNVTVGVVPFAAGLHAGMRGQFVLLDYASANSVVYLEMHTEGLFVEEAEEVRRYRRLFDHLVDSALDADDSIEYLRSTIT
ncbi:transcriptional regulator with XRE-family HTH domain [Nocardiopsis mwathae]|uniref:Transcriptional regulator with XRE-family HTH domain n=1 Tax=Nocardiopsis mwathae TaxID=1472723 RepID=A0A7X0D766_9ACTN|nr:helix-turn-helix transcriptional regulator [Nocardiopsis mwathae]MBB6174020.1 transcriptional regulator with XRE-family HTH domain [Nocardiopsis mwathae]